VFKAVQVLSRDESTVSLRAGIALPANEVHRAQLQSVIPVLRRLGVVVFWVNGDCSVEVDPEDWMASG